VIIDNGNDEENLVGSWEVSLEKGEFGLYELGVCDRYLNFDQKLQSRGSTCGEHCWSVCGRIHVLA
jgi:hypothetical protein